MSDSVSDASSGGQTAKPDDDIVVTDIAGIELLVQRRVVKQLGLTAEEKKKVRAVGDDFNAARQEFFAEEKKRGKPADDSAYHHWKREADKRFLKRAEAVLTPQQAQSLRDATLAAVACYRLMVPERLLAGPNALTQAQNDKLRRIREEDMRQLPRRLDEESDKMLAVLTPQQRVLLRTKILDKALPEANGQWGINVNGESEAVVDLSPAPLRRLQRPGRAEGPVAHRGPAGQGPRNPRRLPDAV